MQRGTLALVIAFTLPGAAAAQHGGVRLAPVNTVPPAEARQFDFLVGKWDLTVTVPAPSLAVRIHGGMPKLVGTWTAAKALDGFGVEDLLRITDAAGNPVSLASAVRVYDAAARRWNSVTVDAYRGRISTATTVEWKNGEVLLTGEGTDPDGKPYLTRTRIFEITAGGFRYQQDRSTDSGKSWTEGALRIVARRAAGGAP